MVPLGPKATNLDHNFEAIKDTGVSSMTLCLIVLVLGLVATAEQLESFGKGDSTHIFLLQPDWCEEDAPNQEDIGGCAKFSCDSDVMVNGVTGVITESC